MLAGEVKPDSGAVTRTRGLKVGYMPQIPTFRPGATVRDVVMEVVDTESGDWEAIGAAEEAMSRLGLKTKTNSREDALVAELSGGLQRKVSLARELAKGPELLLLDEPTNHLDLESILWLEEWFQNFKGAIVMTSHDREFMNRIVKRIVEVANKTITTYSGNYDFYLKEREIRKEQLLASHQKQQDMLAKEHEFIARFAARASHAAQVQSRVKKLDYKN
jgi:ATP-binding cassette subfamily F protein 3